MQFLAAADEERAPFDADRILIDLDEITAERSAAVGIVELTRPLSRGAWAHAA